MAVAKKREELAQIESYNKLVAVCLTHKSQNRRDFEALEATEKVLALNGEFYTVWNYRRDILTSLIQLSSLEERESCLQKELNFSEKAIAFNTKSYSIWFHRKWLSQLLGDTWNWSRELGLCKKLLIMDSRNFHCWAYRQWVATVAKVPTKTSLEFTAEKIAQNFSNYSAWHERSRLLSQEEDFAKHLSQELNLVQQAFYTEPKDQSAWIYYRWLLGLSSNEAANQRSMVGRLLASERTALFREELAKLEELLGEEPTSKWCMLTTVLLLRKVQDNPALATARLIQLQLLDPTHRNYYASLTTPD